jgi:hypothetical protein
MAVVVAESSAMVAVAMPLDVKKRQALGSVRTEASEGIEKGCRLL